MSKPALIRKIMKTLKAMPKKRLAVLCYNITKSKLPRLNSGLQQRRLSQLKFHQAYPSKLPMSKRFKNYPLKKKRKFSKKQLAAQRLFAKRARAGTLRKRRRR